MRDADTLPRADPGQEQDAREWFPLEQTPEEYAARSAHRWLCCSFDDYRYRDPALTAWVRRLGDILFRRDGAPSVAALRERFLSGEERQALERQEGEEF